MTFPGSHGLWVDAKGGAGDPEPRLGWTELGSYTVQEGSAGAGGSGASHAGGSGGAGLGGASATGGAATTDSDDGGCGCRSAGSSGRLPWGLAAVAAAGVALRHRRRSR